MEEDDMIFKMDFYENYKINNYKKKIISDAIEININYNLNENIKKKINSNNNRILSKSPNVSFNNYIPPPSSSYNKKLNDLIKFYRTN